MSLGRVVLCVWLLTQTACSFISERPQQNFQMANRQNFQAPDAWKFEGRIVISDEKDTVTASVVWVHGKALDVIDLSGPLAQGHVRISVTASQLQIDDGDQVHSYVGDPEQIMAEQLGLQVPVKSLKYWVLGLNDPESAFVQTEEGFGQLGWSVKYKSMQKVNAWDLPYKMGVENERTRLKLIVDQWNIL